MGIPLRSNIFKNGTYEQRYFSQFPVQVAVLFSPNDQDFVEAFRSIFLELDRFTGKNLVFFAVLDPPQDWLTEAETRQWWREYTQRIGRIGFSMDDRVLVNEIARLFGIGWGELPQIVASTNLWTGEYLTFPTSSIHIQRQLEILTNLVHELGQPNIDHIAEDLSETLGIEAQYHSPDDALRYRFNRMYDVLDTAERSSGGETDWHARFLDNDFPQVEETLRRFRQWEDNRQIVDRDANNVFNNSAKEKIIEDAAGRLVAPATVAMRISQHFHRGRMLELAEYLEEESLIMVETALTIGNFLENLQNGTLRGMPLLHLGTRGRRKAKWQTLDIDFTPGAQGAWKAFELEVNLSLIQAARASISINMPEFFAIHDDKLSKEDGRVYISKRKAVDINQLDWRNKATGKQRFIMMHDALEVIRKLSGTPNFEAKISMCLGHQLPDSLFDAWKEIHEIRNRGSHVEPLQYRDYQNIIETVLSSNALDPLIGIKSKLARRRIVSSSPRGVSTNLGDMKET
ncbi:hypothetical protein [Dictyobacter formicarum]|uniref:Apea-like HEPN domain-containing protein n=1 Tax=Dictyobacter formicarum TaxID=2778368 RepID=A0ABQ3VRK0_9CHLR|nr:hypothetical protein [Dictyobacter formicarum]GHO88023.1 hypothetical protein KSZ_60290 [Dictyobacter formicarum]